MTGSTHTATTTMITKRTFLVMNSLQNPSFRLEGGLITGRAPLYALEAAEVLIPN
jgi:hypothetical protein